MVDRVGGEILLGATVEPGLETEPGLVLLSAFLYVSGEETIHGEGHKAQGCSIQENRYKEKGGLRLSHNVENRSCKEENQLKSEQGIIQAVGAVTAVQESGNLVTKFHGLVSFHGNNYEQYIEYHRFVNCM